MRMQDLNETKRPSKAARYSGWPESVEAVNAALTKEQPVDGILGITCSHQEVVGLQSGDCLCGVVVIFEVALSRDSIASKSWHRY